MIQSILVSAGRLFAIAALAALAMSPVHAEDLVDVFVAARDNDAQ